MQIIVTTSPRYVHIVPTFARAFARVWPDCPYPASVLYAGCLPELGAGDHRFRVQISRDQGWASSLLGLIGYDDEPFLLLLDDYILDAVDPGLIARAAQILDRDPGVGMIRIHPVPGPTLPWAADPGFGLIDKAQPYAISLQPAIWRPQVCRDLFNPTENPWQIEIKGSERAKAYERFAFLGTIESALGYRNLMRRGEPQADVQAWIEANL